MILMIDNYDSFTFNIVQYLSELGADVKVVRNDQISVAEIEQLDPEKIILSPGPGTPDDAGITLNVIHHFKGKKPMFGVCLGQQSIGQLFGGDIIRAKQIMHGKLSPIYHNGCGVFEGLPQGFNVTRYHSLVVDSATLPDCLEITAWTQDSKGEFDEIMGLRHKQYDIEGVQFHPESILSEYGHELLGQFLKRTVEGECNESK